MAKQFPHLLPADKKLWEEFLETQYNIYDSYDYDVRVGDGRDPGPTYPENIRRDAVLLSQRRIDAVGFRPTSITIIEVSLDAGLTQVGQMSVYPVLYQQTFKPQLPLERLIVARRLQDGIETTLQENRIPYVLIP